MVNVPKVWRKKLSHSNTAEVQQKIFHMVMPWDTFLSLPIHFQQK